MIFQTQGVDAKVNLQRLWQSTQDQDILSLSTESGKWTQVLTPNQEGICSCQLLGWKSVFSGGVSLGMSTVHQGRPHGQPYLANPKGTQWHFCGLLFHSALFGHFLSFQSFACLLLFIWGLLCSLFCFLKEESNPGWVGRWGRSGRNRREEKHNENALFVKNFKN